MFASFANQADILIAEREALIGFAGPRVRAVNNSDQDRVLSEEILERGLIDNIVPRNELKHYLERVLSLITANEIKVSSPQTSINSHQKHKISNGWESVTTSRVLDRPCLLYTSPSPRDATLARMPSSA